MVFIIKSLANEQLRSKRNIWERNTEYFDGSARIESMGGNAIVKANFGLFFRLSNNL